MEKKSETEFNLTHAINEYTISIFVGIGNPIWPYVRNILGGWVGVCEIQDGHYRRTKI